LLHCAPAPGVGVGRQFASDVQERPVLLHVPGATTGAHSRLVLHDRVTSMLHVPGIVRQTPVAVQSVVVSILHRWLAFGQSAAVVQPAPLLEQVPNGEQPVPGAQLAPLKLHVVPIVEHCDGDVHAAMVPLQRPLTGQSLGSEHPARLVLQKPGCVAHCVSLVQMLAVAVQLPLFGHCPAFMHGPPVALQFPARVGHWSSVVQALPATLQLPVVLHTGGSHFEINRHTGHSAPVHVSHPGGTNALRHTGGSHVVLESQVCGPITLMQACEPIEPHVLVGRSQVCADMLPHVCVLPPPHVCGCTLLQIGAWPPPQVCACALHV